MVIYLIRACYFTIQFLKNDFSKDYLPSKTWRDWNALFFISYISHFGLKSENFWNDASHKCILNGTYPVTVASLTSSFLPRKNNFNTSLINWIGLCIKRSRSSTLKMWSSFIFTLTGYIYRVTVDQVSMDEDGRLRTVHPSMWTTDRLRPSTSSTNADAGPR